MGLREIKDEIYSIESRIASNEENQELDAQQLQSLKSRLHFLYLQENCYEEYSAGIL